MDNGWIKLHRKLTQNPRSNDPDWLALWIHLLILATHQSRKALFNGKMIELQPGQLITGRKILSHISGVNETKVQRLLLCFESEQQIEQQTTFHSRLITIKNWTEYQQSEQQNGQVMNSKWTASEQPVNTIQEYKELKNERKTSKVAGEMFSKFWEVYPNKKAKYAAVKSFSRLTEAERTRVQEVLPRHCKQEQWTKDNGRFIPLASTWLNGKRFEDELKISGVGRKMDWEEGMEEYSIKI